MELCSSAGRRSTKKSNLLGLWAGGKGVYCCSAKVYSCSSRARDLLRYIFFFLD
jgi:hypothetical protein